MDSAAKLPVAERTPQTIGILIASYRRPHALVRCLMSLGEQTLRADEVLVICRQDDEETNAVLSEFASGPLPVRRIVVRTPGVVAARNAGLAACTTDIVSMIDDDTVPLPDFLEQVMHHFRADPTLGGLGGRDRCFGPAGFDDHQESVVGEILWFGKAVGNHHRGFGSLRTVDLLKGANMSYRAEAIVNVRFDLRLKGSGAQPCDDFCFSVAIKREGWKLAYDPKVLVHHFASQREEARLYVGVQVTKDHAAFQGYAYNQVLAIWAALSPSRRVAFLFWSVLIGTGTFPGVVQAVRFTPSLGWNSWQRFLVAQHGKFEAMRDLLLARPAETGR